MSSSSNAINLLTESRRLRRLLRLSWFGSYINNVPLVWSKETRLREANISVDFEVGYCALCLMKLYSIFTSSDHFLIYNDRLGHIGSFSESLV